jgi:CheY-like chemotaxis protein
MSVLLVDDVAETREMYALYFQHLGLRLLTAADGFTAVEAARLERPDVVVLDLAMPGAATGWEVIRTLKADRRTRAIPIIVLSGQRARDSALELGADSYLDKPCVPDDVFAEVLKVLQRPSP